MVFCDRHYFSIIVNTNESGIIHDAQYAEHTSDEALIETEDFILS